jgi:hypothetical protein
MSISFVMLTHFVVGLRGVFRNLYHSVCFVVSNAAFIQLIAVLSLWLYWQVVYFNLQPD